MDRAVKSLAKELEINVSVELANAQAVKVSGLLIHTDDVEGHYDNC